MIKGYRLKVYRAEGTTQWFSAITSDYNEEERVSELSIIKRCSFEGRGSRNLLI